MKNIYLSLLVFFMIVACNQKSVTVIPKWVGYDESEEIAGNADHESVRMRFKLIQSKTLDKNDMWKVVEPQIRNFSEEEYERMKPLILGQDISTLQSHIRSGEFTYEKLIQWYLYRIVKFENDKDKMLNAIVAINPHAVKEARARDKALARNKEGSSTYHLIYGMPILVKDNIGVEGMPTQPGRMC